MMAIRNIRIMDDEILRKRCKPVREMTPKTRNLIEDMLDTMYLAGGVGLAASQVGVLKRIIVIDAGDGPIVLINPEIVAAGGEQTGMEGCLSLPGKHAKVTRPNYIKVKAQNKKLEEIEVEGEGLLARAICHECDHLEGIMYVDIMEGELQDVAEDEDEDE